MIRVDRITVLKHRILRDAGSEAISSSDLSGARIHEVDALRWEQLIESKIPR